MVTTMDRTEHTLACLFAQLGLANSPADIEFFVSDKRGLDNNIKLADASFWSSAQADFIRTSIEEDSDWSEIVDVLDSMLRH